MNYRSTNQKIAVILWVVALLLATSLGLYAHGGEDHGEAAPAPVSTPGAIENQLVTDGTTNLFELLLKYPVVEADEETRFRLFLADYATNRPIENATFDLSFKPAGVSVKEQPHMLSPGIYEMVAVFPDDTVYSMVATVKAGQRTDFVEVRNIYAGEAAEHFLADHTPGASTQTEDSSGLPWWGIALIGIAVLVIVAVAVMRRRQRLGTAATSIARDPELSRQDDRSDQSGVNQHHQESATTTEKRGGASNE